MRYLQLSHTTFRARLRSCREGRSCPTVRNSEERRRPAGRASEGMRSRNTTHHWYMSRRRTRGRIPRADEAYSRELRSDLAELVLDGPILPTRSWLVGQRIRIQRLSSRRRKPARGRRVISQRRDRLTGPACIRRPSACVQHASMQRRDRLRDQLTGPCRASSMRASDDHQREDEIRSGGEGKQT